MDRGAFLPIASALLALLATGAGAQEAAAPASSTPGVALPTIDVIATTPLSGSGVDVDKVPAAVTTIDSHEIAEEKSPNVVNALDARTASVDVQSVSGNPFQPDVYFRGFDASPVSGTPQGLAVYQNGVRINEAFGDVVNWDLIPTVAIRSMDVVSANPVFGLNALGGAISIKMKDGFGYQGASIDVMGGSYGRAETSLQWGQQVGNWASYIAVEGVTDNGFRQQSGSTIRRIYGDIGYKGDSAELHLNVGGASNEFGATAAAPFELLQQNWSSIYTWPQGSVNQVAYVNATANVNLSPTWSLQANAYLRDFFQRTVDGNATNAAPCSYNSALLCYPSVSDPNAPANGLNGTQLANPFSSTATPGEIDRTSTQTTSMGTTVQATSTDKLFGLNNHFVGGASFDYGVTNFGASAELGTILPNFYVAGSGVFLGPSGDPVSDGPVSLRATNAYTGLFATDTLDVTEALALTAGARFNIADIRLQDQLGTSLNGQDVFTHFNPMLGATYKIGGGVTAYASYSESNRAPTPLELGCADPAHPCVLASFLVSDPPLKQVVAQTYEAGFRGSHDFGADAGTFSWKLGAYRTDSANDILDVADPIQQGFGYFVNVGATRRQGVEAEATYKTDKYTLSASYAYIDATFLNSFTLASNSPAANAAGLIQVNPGNQIPMIPHNRLKLAAEYSITPSFKIVPELFAVGSQYFAGDASNQEPRLPGYAVVDLNASYQVTKNIELYARVENLLDHRYYTYGTFFDTTAVPNFANGGAPFVDPRTLSPAAPRAIYVGLRATF
jgi:outer membrane receptor protein involved in Fe transport